MADPCSDLMDALCDRVPIAFGVARSGDEYRVSYHRISFLLTYRQAMELLRRITPSSPLHDVFRELGRIVGLGDVLQAASHKESS